MFWPLMDQVGASGRNVKSLSRKKLKTRSQSNLGKNFESYTQSCTVCSILFMFSSKLTFFLGGGTITVTWRCAQRRHLPIITDKVARFFEKNIIKIKF